MDLNYAILAIIGLGIIAMFVIIVALIKRYKRCPSDQLLVVYGKTGKNKEGEISTAKVTHGGGAFIWPIIQDYTFMDLKPIPIEINLTKALSKQNIRIDVPSSVTVAISTEKAVMQNAAERLLGLMPQAIAKMAEDIIFGQMRLVIATMNIEEINSDRDTFLEKIQESLEPELSKIGLKLINVNVIDIRDESGYIQALGRKAAAEATQQAAIDVAEKEKEGAIGVAEADKAKRTQVAKATAEAEIGEANAEQEKRTATASANAKAVEGENKAAVEIAKTTSSRQVAEAEAEKVATAAKNVAVAEANTESYNAQEKAEKARADRDTATQYANVVVPAQIAKQKVVVDAEAEAERIKKLAEGEAAGQFAKMQAEAKGIYEILTKTAEGYDKIVKAAGSPQGAVQMILADKLETIIAKQVEAIKGVKIDNITVWDSGSGNGGNGSTADFLQSFLKFAPPMEQAFGMVGAEFPKFLQGAKTQAEAELATKVPPVKSKKDKPETPESTEEVK